MITTLKLAGISALLSAGLVTGFSGPEQRVPAPSGKIFHDRAGDSAAASVALASIDPRALATVEVNRTGKTDRVRTREDVRCTDAAWLLVPADCAPNFDASPARTVELRAPGNVSSLIRDGEVKALASR
ncbi:hypothetical protein [Enterovirga aerilata]|uniref:Uncharacterized protein n=1 Tax=Enterovirga aerilata TaxID=2730920 RepID=A0A849I759_9HYPH|nr:hypothetical protein [Enterovirga sp. DB1703]